MAGETLVLTHTGHPAVCLRLGDPEAVIIEHARLCGGLGWVGVNTGVISARRAV